MGKIENYYNEGEVVSMQTCFNVVYLNNVKSKIPKVEEFFPFEIIIIISDWLLDYNSANT